MKKVLTILFVSIIAITLVGCNEKKANKKRSYEELIDLYVRAINEENYKLLLEATPAFMKPFIEEELNNENIKEYKKYFGTNTKMSIEVTGKTKMDDEWLKYNNGILKSEFNTDTEAKECYALEGTITYKSDEKEENQKLEEVWYCNFDGEWLLMFG